MTESEAAGWMDIDERSYDLGHSLGLWEAESMAIEAYNLGEIDLYIRYVTPKSMSEWLEWENEYGSHDDMRARWKHVPEDSE
jgi:hypothetical protein